MSNQLIQYAFVAGEISEKLFGRTDFEKYDLGLKKALNWFVDYRGGLTTRPGTLFIDWMDGAGTRFFPFQFSPDTSNTYVVIFGEGWIRFVQDGGYVLQAPKTITNISRANPCVVSSTLHGFSNGDLVQIAGVVGMTQVNGRTFKVSNVAANSFHITTQTGDELDSSGYTAYVSGGTASRVYTVTHTYNVSDLPDLQAKQIGDFLRLTHKNYPIRNLTRAAHTSWTLANEVFRGNAGFVTSGAATPSAAGNAGAGYVVTFIDSDGNESAPSYTFWLTNSVDFTVTAGSATINWTATSGAVSYRIYRTRVLADDGDLTSAMSFGLLGFAHGNTFTDNNIIPDFTVQPPLVRDPFSAGQVDTVAVTTAGSGYDPLTTTISSSGGGGSGFRAEPVIVGGAVTFVRILDHGSSYATVPTISVVGGGGAGAVLTPTLTDRTSPRTSARFQQRQVYAGSNGFPLRIWGSQPGYLSNFNEGEIVSDDLAFEFDIDAPDVAPIRHLLPVRGGLLALTESGIWVITGDQGRAVTLTNAIAEPQTYVGVSKVEPLTIDTELLYITSKESTVRLLTYNDVTKIYGGQDMSILSSHLFSQTNPIVRWSYTEAPYRNVWSVREDGTFCCFSIVKEQNVYAWTPCETQGFVRDVVTLTEDGRDVTYLAVRRAVNGIVVRYIERFADRELANERAAEDAVCVDSALTQPATSPNSTLGMVAGFGDGLTEGASVRFLAGSSVFGPSQVGYTIRVAGGKFTITTYINATTVTATVKRPISEFIPQTTRMKPIFPNNWTLDDPDTVFSNLWHLEGLEVAILADGVVQSPQVVTNGEITLISGVTRCVIGLPFTCTAQTLPLTAPNALIEGKRKHVYGAAIRRYQSRGLLLGTDPDALFNMSERTDELTGEPTRLQTDMRYELVTGVWDISESLYLVVEDPLPCSILGFVPDIEVGDDTN